MHINRNNNLIAYVCLVYEMAVRAKQIRSTICFWRHCILARTHIDTVKIASLLASTTSTGCVLFFPFNSIHWYYFRIWKICTELSQNVISVRWYGNNARCVYACLVSKVRLTLWAMTVCFNNNHMHTPNSFAFIQSIRMAERSARCELWGCERKEAYECVCGNSVERERTR